MTGAQLLVDAYGRIRDLVHRATDGLTPAQVAIQIEPDANSIAWLVWHLTRIQDDHLADASGRPQVWTSQGWVERFALPFDRDATGHGHTGAEVAAVRVEATDLLVGYHDAVHDSSVSYLEQLADADFDRIVDTSWDPPVSLGVRLVSVISDNLQHAGQAAYVRGIIARRSS